MSFKTTAPLILAILTISARCQGKFEGYKMSLKPCKHENAVDLEPERPTICMFHQDCLRLRGVVVDSCQDGFMIGSCCQLPKNYFVASGPSVHQSSPPSVTSSSAFPADQTSTATTTTTVISPTISSTEFLSSSVAFENLAVTAAGEINTTESNENTATTTTTTTMKTVEQSVKPTATENLTTEAATEPSMTATTLGGQTEPMNSVSFLAPATTTVNSSQDDATSTSTTMRITTVEETVKPVVADLSTAAATKSPLMTAAILGGETVPMNSVPVSFTATTMTVQSSQDDATTTTTARSTTSDPTTSTTTTTTTATSGPAESSTTGEQPSLDSVADKIPMPDFDDQDLELKVNLFVKKIVQSLQGNFHDLKDVVYKKNVTTTSTTEKPSPSIVAQNLDSSVHKKPEAVLAAIESSTTSTTTTTTTKKPTTTRRPTSTVKAETAATATTPKPRRTTTPFPKVTPNAHFRSICGIRPLAQTKRRRAKIVGGEDAYFGEWPWQVMIQETSWLGFAPKNKCGGVLITDRHVLTAAHCQPSLFNSLYAVFGEWDTKHDVEPRRSVTRKANRIIVHPDYQSATFENDLAVLEFDKPIKFDEHIIPICLPDDPHKNYDGSYAFATGWGRVEHPDGEIAHVLQKVKVPIIDNSVCQYMFNQTRAGQTKKIVDSFLCAGFATGQKDACEGDSGGPLSMLQPNGRWVLVGTVSHGIRCAAPYLPGVYMKMTHFKPWINRVTGQFGKRSKNPWFL